MTRLVNVCKTCFLLPILESREGPTNVQVMHMTKAEGRTIELSVENLTYIHTDEDDQEMEEEKEDVAFEDMDEVARNLFTFRLDHDYTPLTSPKESPEREFEPVDELAETLSLLDGGDVESVPVSPQKVVVKSAPKIPVIKKSAVTQPQSDQQLVSQKTMKATEVKPQQKTRQTKAKTKEVEEIDYDEEDEDFEEELDDNDDNDSDFELEEPKQRASKRSQRTRSAKSTPDIKKHIKAVKTPVTKSKTPAKQVVEDKPQEKLQPVETPTTPTEKQPEKKQVKKEKKTPKPIPDDFALFSTPDIIRRVGGKEQVTPPSPEAPAKQQPAKISPESRSKSNSEQRSSINQKQPVTRLSVDSKSAPEKVKAPITYSVRRVSADKRKTTTKPANEPKASVEVQKDLPDDTQAQTVINETANPTNTEIDLVPPSEDVSADALDENTKDYSALPDVNMDQSNINLETAGLELDQSILDNINSDMISDDILYQVAKQLVDNTDLQNAIDKSLAEGNLVLDPALISGTQDDMQNVQQNNEVSSTCLLNCCLMFSFLLLTGRRNRFLCE